MAWLFQVDCGEEWGESGFLVIASRSFALDSRSFKLRLSGFALEVPFIFV